MSSHAQGPTGARRRLRAALRAARQAADLTQVRAAESLDWSLSKLIRIEAGSVGVSTTDIRALLQLYHVEDQTEVDVLVALARLARQRDWLAPFKEHLPGAYLAYLGLEQEADRLRFFQMSVVPGILQTPAYGAAVIRATASAADDVDETRLRADLDLRQQRQQNLLSGVHGPAVEVLIDEAVLHRDFGQRGVLAQQLRQLAGLVDAARITVRVLPFSAQINTVGGPFVILEFDNDADADAVYLENSLSAARFFDRVDGIARYRVAFARLSAAAMSRAESARHLTEAARRLEDL